MLLVLKSQKDHTRTSIDQIVNDKILPDFQVDKPGRSNRHNINTSLIIYTAALQKLNAPSTILFHNIRASYDIDTLCSFLNLDNKKIKSTNINNMNSDATDTTVYICNEDSATAQSLSREDFLQM